MSGHNWYTLLYWWIRRMQPSSTQNPKNNCTSYRRLDGRNWLWFGAISSKRSGCTKERSLADFYRFWAIRVVFVCNNGLLLSAPLPHVHIISISWVRKQQVRPTPIIMVDNRRREWKTLKMTPQRTTTT